MTTAAEKKDRPTASKAIRELVPNASFVVKNDRGVLGYEIVKWNTDDKKPTDSEVQSKIGEMQSAFDAQEYARNRKAEYPDWGTQLEKIADDGIDAWKTDMLEPVKAKFPKP